MGIPMSLVTAMQKRSAAGMATPQSSDGVPGGKNMPEIVAQIVWIRQMAHKIEETCQTVKSLLADLAGTSKFLEQALEFLDELKTNERDRVCQQCEAFNRIY